MISNKDIKDSINYLFKKQNIKSEQYKPRQTYNFIINGPANSGKDSFVECCSRFAPVNNISTIDLVKSMALIVGLEKDREFLNKLKELVYKHTNFIDKSIEMQLKPGYLNFIHVREETFFTKQPYKSMNRILIERPGYGEDRFKFNPQKYDHIILNVMLEKLPYKAHKFVKIYCDPL